MKNRQSLNAHQGNQIREQGLKWAKDTASEPEPEPERVTVNDLVAVFSATLRCRQPHILHTLIVAKVRDTLPGSAPRILSPKTSLNAVSGPFGPQNSTARAGALVAPPHGSLHRASNQLIGLMHYIYGCLRPLWMYFVGSQVNWYACLERRAPGGAR